VYLDRFGHAPDPFGMVSCASRDGYATCEGDCPDAVQQDADPADPYIRWGDITECGAHPSVVHAGAIERSSTPGEHPIGTGTAASPSIIAGRQRPACPSNQRRIRHSRAHFRRRGARRVGTLRRRRFRTMLLGAACLHRSCAARHRRRLPESNRPAQPSKHERLTLQRVSPRPLNARYYPDNLVHCYYASPEAGG